MQEAQFLIEVLKASAPAGVLVYVIHKLLEYHKQQQEKTIESHRQQVDKLFDQTKELIGAITEYINYNSNALTQNTATLKALQETIEKTCGIASEKPQ